MASDEKVQMLLDFTGFQLTRDDAKRLLAIEGHDVQAAVSKFFETDGTSLRNLLANSNPRWDETAFGAGRYGNDDTSDAPPTFNIDYAPGYDNYPHSAGQSRAPTRPPSRTSLRSTLSTHAGDAPMQSIENLQESGLVGNSKPAFGPANKDYYDAAQWAMVPTATEVIADPIPSHRQREEGQPAILKPSPNFNYLPALIPILHSIPAFRNALLCPTVSQPKYWMGDDWWKGSPEEQGRIVDTSIGLAEAQGLDIIYEAQRLMAFLDSTDRVYGSISSLLELDAWKETRINQTDPDDDLLNFLVFWSFAYSSQVPDANLNGNLRSTVDLGDSIQENFVLETSVTRDHNKADFTIYDVLDESLFAASGRGAHLVDISNVLILRLTSSRTDASDLGCRIPATLYADRYLEENRHVIDGMYRDMQQYENELKEIDTQAHKLRYHQPKKDGAKPVDSLKLLQTSIKAFEPKADEDPKDAPLLAQLQDLYQSIERQLSSLDAQAQEIRKTIDGITARFKPTVQDGWDISMDTTNIDYPEGQTPQDAMNHPYQLYGVATRRDVVYLLHPDIFSNDPGAKQWWRVQYDTEGSNPVIMRDPLTEQEVIERATSESASALLVYANEAATSVEPISISKPLEDFVKRDNLNFHQELQASNTAHWDTFGDSYADIAQEQWEDVPTDSADYTEWNDMSASQFHVRAHNDSNVSSTTLTPNTDVGDDSPGVREMIEVNGGMDALAGLSTVESATGAAPETMDVDTSQQEQGRVNFVDATMEDVHDEPRVQHIEITEKKGG